MILTIYSGDIADRYGAGNWKDIKSFQRLLKCITDEVIEVPFDINEPEYVLDACSMDVSDILVHYSFWPELIQDIRRAFPHIRIHIRTHNAEALQHWQRATVRFSLRYENLRAIYGSLRLLLQDSNCRRLADSLLGISDWDNRHYWRFLPGRAEVYDVPYHSPWPELRPLSIRLPYEEREAALVCMPGGRDPIGRKMVEGFVRIAEQFRKYPDCREWKFLLSRGILTGGQDVPASPAVDLLEQLDEPWDLLCSSRAVAVLTPLGFGTKTTVIDGIAAGCHVIVHPVIASRLPAEVSKLCIPCDPRIAEDIENLKECLKVPPRSNNANDILRTEALNNLRTALGQRFNG